MDSLRIFAYGSVASTYALIVIGGYVSSTGSGMACPDWPLCPGPPWAVPVLIEYTHRLFTLVVTFFVTSTMLLAWTRYRREGKILTFSTVSFLLLVAQIILGMFTVRTGLDPVVSTAHLGLGSGVFGLVLITAAYVNSQRLERSELQR